MEPRPPVPHYFRTARGDHVGLSLNRWDEHHRRLRVTLPIHGTYRDYAPLIDMVRPVRGHTEWRYLGITARRWLFNLQRSLSPDRSPGERWFIAWIAKHRERLDRRPRVPNNHYAIQLASPPIAAALVDAIAGLGLRRAPVEQWLATLKGLTARGIRAEELDLSGILERLSLAPPLSVWSMADVLRRIDLEHVRPKLVREASFGYVTAKGWVECCARVTAPKFTGRSGRASATDANREPHAIRRYWLDGFDWSVVRESWRADLVSPRRHVWRILDDHGKPLHNAKTVGFDDPQSAMAAADYEISRRHRTYQRSIDRPAWRRYTLPGATQYREILVQLDNWPQDYRSRHYRTRNVLVHLRISVRPTEDGRRVLFLDEVQSDWHADLHAQSKDAGTTRQRTVASAPFAKEWPLLALKLMLWWAQELGVDGLSLSTPALQNVFWSKYKPPDALYRKTLPKAAAQLCRALKMELSEAVVEFRAFGRHVSQSAKGWIVCKDRDVPLTKPFATREQAERFADLTSSFVLYPVPTIWLGDLPPIERIPLFGVAF